MFSRQKRRTRCRANEREGMTVELEQEHSEAGQWASKAYCIMLGNRVASTLTN